MPDIIQLLPDHVANKIAAGEVVQRPASIVKELIENAIDAAATKIELIVRDAGRNLVQVVDNGKGMSPTDARMAFERHATSKIKSTEDIFKIVSKGFRGEALASIAAVAQVELKTKPEDAPIGTTLYIEGGTLQFQEPSPTTTGTSISVKNLFYNVPARRKFLKNNNIEFRHILDEFHRLALAHENIEFSLFHNDAPIFKLRKTTPLQRIVDIFGRKLQPLLIPIKEDLDWIKLHGFVAKPEGAKKTRGEQFFFVNGRYFKSPYLNKAVQEAFEGLLKHGYTPSYFLFLETEPDKIDVNVHPQKTEIKFEDEHLIFALIRSTIKRSLGIYNISPSLDFNKNTQLEDLITQSSSAPTSSAHRHDTPIRVDHDFNPFEQEKNTTPAHLRGIREMYQTTVEASPSKINLFEDEDFDEELMRLPNGYWLINKEDKTFMMDLGRMNRLLVAERNRKTEENKIVANPLLFSIEYHMSEMEKSKYRTIKKYLPDLGFHIDLAHESVLRIQAAPEGLKETQVHQFLEGLFEKFDERNEHDFSAYFLQQWNKVQNKSRFDFVNKSDAELVIKEFTALGFPQYLPDGKRCYIELPLEMLKNKF